MSGAAVTRTDVARLAGVSTAVVSYVINGGPKRVAPATAERVRKAVADLHYQPNANARALTTGSPRLLGFIAPDLTNSFFAELSEAVGAAAAAHGFDLIVASTGDDPERETSITVNLVGRRVDGIIAATTLDPISLAAMAATGSTSRVLIDDAITIPGIASITTDLEDGAFQATCHLVDHGYRDIAMVTGPPRSQRVDSRRLGWNRALGVAGLTPGAVVETTFTRQGGYEAIRRLLQVGPPPRAIFAASDLLAVGVLRALHEGGLDVPGDVAVVSFDGSAESDYSRPRLTSLRQPITLIAQLAVSHALRIGTPEPQTLATRIKGELMIRESCGCDEPSHT